MGFLSHEILEKIDILLGLYHDHEKPEDFSILLDFIEKAIDLTLNGTKLLHKKHSFEILMFLFDAFAKESLLSVNCHSEYKPCTKCNQEDEFLANKICFSEFNFYRTRHTL